MTPICVHELRLSSQWGWMFRSGMNLGFLNCRLHSGRRVESYINNEGKRCKTSCVSEIHQSRSPDQWHPSKGQDNPAIISLGCLVSELPESWYHRPEFFGTFKSDWSQQVHVDVFVSDDDEEIRDGVSLNTAVDVLLAPYLNYYRIYRIEKALCW